MKIFLLLALVVCAYAQNQDLCSKVPNNGGHRFADDPSACRNYLWCNYNAADELVSVHQDSCDEGFHFNSENGACDANHGCDLNLCIANTVATETKRIAVATDSQCRTFQVCTGTVISDTIMNCTSPAVFNRNFGVCTVESIAPCGSNSGGGGGSPGPSCEEDGFVDDKSRCDKFFFCENNNFDELICPPGFHFNPDVKYCDYPENLNPPCETSAKATHKVIPRPVHINGGIAKLRKIFSKL